MATVTKTRRPPAIVRCEWKLRAGTRDVYDCAHCGHWTANLPLYRYDICDARDRRKRSTDRRRA